MINLVRNAIDAVRQSTGHPRSLTIQSRVDQDGSVGIAVCDTGVGLRDDVSERMFEPFFTTKPDGLGLGLLISRSIVEAHGGRLWATPNPVRGTTFHLMFPASEGVGNARR
jgi:two-component system sensor kinase FixL